MSEVDMKPIESVQVGLSIFGSKNDHRKLDSTSSDSEENEKEREVECLLKELASYRVQLEAKDSAYKQSLFQLDHHQKLAEIDRKKHKEQCIETRDCVSELESEVKDLKADIEAKEKENSYQALYIAELKLQLKSADEEIRFQKYDFEMFIDELQKVKEQASEAQDEVALLKSELEKAKLKLSATEGVKMGLFLAWQKVIEETEKMDKESIKLKEEAVRKAEDESSIKYELEKAKKELEVAAARIRELRNRAEQAATRAEEAEKAKAGLEDKVRRWEEQKKKRREALAAALNGVSSDQPNREINCKEMPKSDTSQPLGKILNMKF